jgi:hypothetical protein
MVLKVGTIQNYNNNIRIANNKMKPGKNDINTLKRILVPLMERSKPKTFRMKANSEPVEPLKVSKTNNS